MSLDVLEATAFEAEFEAEANTFCSQAVLEDEDTGQSSVEPAQPP